MNKLIVALDVNSFAKAKKLVDRLSPCINIFKVGSELFTCCGPQILRYITKKRKKIFLDLKFFDIPNTVEKACLAAARHNVFMLTLHASGGYEMLKKAVNAFKGNKKKPLLIGVTVLTSMKTKNAAKDVIKLAGIAKKAGLDGVISSPKETKQIKKAYGKKIIVVNPGIRPVWTKKDLSAGTKHDKYLVKADDQKRTTTPKEAIQNGADFIVVGRPIVKAKDPVLAARKILKDTSEVWRSYSSEVE